MHQFFVLKPPPAASKPAGQAKRAGGEGTAKAKLVSERLRLVAALTAAAFSAKIPRQLVKKN
jgi:hypothetical protein